MREKYGVGVWKAIKIRCESFKSRMVFRVGNWWSVKFWMDWWCGDESLGVVFLALSLIALLKVYG